MNTALRRWRVNFVHSELGVSRSGYYARLNRPMSEREKQDRNLLGIIVDIFEENDQRYGSPRIWQELVKEWNQRLSRKRVERLMREAGLKAKGAKKWVKTTDSDHKLPVAENILNREFTASGPGEKWVSDITYVRTSHGWMYLAVILDLWDRKVVGWAMADNMEAGLVVNALVMACLNRTPREGLIFHSDRGVQYCSQELADKIISLCPSVKRSMSRKSNCWDNACAESFFKTLKRELDVLKGRHTKNQVKTGIFEYIEIYYNRCRRHSALGYATPLALTNNKAA